MKTTYRFLSFLAISILFVGCSTGTSTYAYDDIYYNPKNNPIKQAQTKPADLQSKNTEISYDGSYANRYEGQEKPADYPQSVYNNRYTENQENQENQSNENEETFIDDGYSDAEYYDEDYAAVAQRINSPVRSLNTYDVYERDRILYTYDPFFTPPRLYNSFGIYDPFLPSTGLSLGWNSFAGWNVGINYGAGFGYNCLPRTFYNPWANPFFTHYDPFFGFYNGGYYWNNFYGFNSFYGYNSVYYDGYNRGYNNGYYHGNNNAWNSRQNVGRTRITAPRGNSGSRTTTNATATRPTRPSRANRTASPSSTPNNSASPRPERATTTQPSSEPTRPSRETPQRYQQSRTPSSYSTPSTNPRPVRTETRPQTTKPEETRPQQSNPSYTRPRSTNTYNRPVRVEPRQQQARPRQQQAQPRQQQARPQRQSTPRYNTPRPTYNNSSTPSYSPPARSTPSRSSGGSSSGGSSRPSRPSRR